MIEKPTNAHVNERQVAPIAKHPFLILIGRRFTVTTFLALVFPLRRQHAGKELSEILYGQVIHARPSCTCLERQCHLPRKTEFSLPQTAVRGKTGSRVRKAPVAAAWRLTDARAFRILYGIHLPQQKGQP